MRTIKTYIKGAPFYIASVANFSLAINQSFRDKKDGNVQRVEWVRCVAWGKLAEIAARFVTTGKQLWQARHNCFYAEDRFMCSNELGLLSDALIEQFSIA